MQASAHTRSGPGQWLSEAVSSFTLVLVILGLARRRSDFVLLVVSLTVTAEFWFASSAFFANPAITIAQCLSDSFSGIAPSDVPGFILAQIGGALFGLAAARYLFADPVQRQS